MVLPPTPYDACEKVSTRATSISMVRYRGNDYSVPVAYAHHEVQVRGYVGEVVIGAGTEVIARHRRSYEKADMVFDPLHFLPLPEKKIGALDQAAPLQGWELPGEFATLRRLLDLTRWPSPPLEQVLPDLGTRLSLALLQRSLDPETVLKAGRSALRKSIAAHASGNHPHSGPFVETLIDGLRQAARQARALHRQHVDFGELQAEVALEVDICAEQDGRNRHSRAPYRRALCRAGSQGAARQHSRHRPTSGANASGCSAHGPALPFRRPHAWLLRALPPARR